MKLTFPSQYLTQLALATKAISTHTLDLLFTFNARQATCRALVALLNEHACLRELPTYTAQKWYLVSLRQIFILAHLQLLLYHHYLCCVFRMDSTYHSYS